jgi:XisH protein
MARDLYHQNVREALEKDGWVITHDPYFIKLGGRDSVEADLGAEKMLQAVRDNQKIVVEIKSFLNRSIVHDFHGAYGQFAFYKKALAKFDHDRKIFLAMPLDIYNEFDNKPYFKEFMETEMCLLIFDPIENTIYKWLN